MKNFLHKGKKAHAGGSEEVSLQITSMADIFTILLVFLLKSYATGTISPTSAGLMLPEAQAGDVSSEALKIEVTQAGVQVEGQSVAGLSNYAFEKADLQANGTSKTLSAALEKQRQKQILIAKSNSSVKVDPKIVVLADKRVPYGTLKTVLASAAVQGYTDFKLAVVKGE
jgi:biopolymer transport protein ExbD